MSVYQCHAGEQAGYVFSTNDFQPTTTTPDTFGGVAAHVSGGQRGRARPPPVTPTAALPQPPPCTEMFQAEDVIDHTPMLVMVAHAAVAHGEASESNTLQRDIFMASHSQIINQIGATSRFVMCFAPSTFGPGSQRSQPKHVSNPDSVMKKFKPHFIYDWGFRPRS